MFSESYSFPHPVLGLNDDINGRFEVEMKVDRNSEERKLRFYDIEYRIENDYINKLLLDGKVSPVFKVYCSSTFQTWTITNPNRSFEIDENDLYNKIEIDVFIVTNVSIPNYTHTSFNTQFNGFSFILEKNEIVALSGKITMQIEKSDEKLGLGNIFKFFSHDQEKPIEFSYNQDKIHIIYPKDGENHPPNAFFKIKPWTAYNIFIVPALEGAFKFAETEPLEVEGYEWFTLLTNVLPKDQWDADPYANAQLFLKDLPVLKAYKELSQ